MKEVLTKNLASTVKERTEKIPEKVKESLPSKENRSKNIDLYKRQDSLERNRASSMRCRVKRKLWIEHLQTSMQYVTEQNTSLQKEVQSLRSEVVKLKALLLAHKDCPITKAMEEGENFTDAICFLVINGPI